MSVDGSGTRPAGRGAKDPAGPPGTPAEQVAAAAEDASRHVAAVVEDVVNRWSVAVLRRRGWVPRAQVNRGYGASVDVPAPHAPGWVRVFGRVLMGRPETPYRAWVRSRGWRSFITAQVAHAPLLIEVGGCTYRVHADRTGLVDVVLQVDLPPGRHPVRMTPEGGETGVGEVLVVGAATGAGLVSDIDDTVMVTWLPRPFIAAWNTFVRQETARAEVPGMPELYTEFLTANPGAFVVYLSTGAWNTAPFLRRFLRRHGYPTGPLLLTDWGPTNTGWFRSGRVHKISTLRRLHQELPHLRWLLVGDDGQHDPEIYSAFSREEPDAVQAVLLRELSPAEQVLSRGLAPPESDGGAGAVPVLHGGDGHRLAERLRAVGLLPTAPRD
ncbi:App1 family protein [Aquipuribacter hungaricus]|uniref:App1 family protein n=1 Tax=Aquipuribacter hungaricus TaxID=545624 RepID=A0ABV7WJV2_9MICO